MKNYRGVREGEGTADPGVVFVMEDGRQEPLRHRKQHSPTGMNWGYGGSGPADLARSLLADYFGLPENEQVHPALYQRFKERIIAHLPQDGEWLLTGEQIAVWLQGNLAQSVPEWLEETEMPPEVSQWDGVGEDPFFPWVEAEQARQIAIKERHRQPIYRL